jgi:hypothetical protein
MFTFLILVFLSLQAVNAATDTDHYSDLQLSGGNTALTSISASINPESGDIYLFSNTTNTLLRISETSEVDTLATLDFDAYRDFERKMIDTDPTGSFIYFWDTGVGRVYTFDLTSGILSRIDQSFNHKNQFNHAAFVDQQSRINAMGGYGLWTYKNYKTRFTEEDLEWIMPGNIQSYDPIPASQYGHLFKYDGLFYYLVEDHADPRSTPVVYHCNYPNNRWAESRPLSTLMRKVSLRPSNRTPWFRHNGTYRLDRNQGLFGFLSSQNESQTFNLLDVTNQKLHQINTSDFNLSSARAVFYSDRIDRWIIIGHPHSLGQRDELYIRTFEFSEDHPWVNTYTPPVWHSYFWIIGIAIASGVVLIIYIGIRMFLNRKKETVTENEFTHPVHFRLAENRVTEVFFNGTKFSYIGDQSLESFLNILFEMASNQVSEMLVSNLDERLFSSSSHSSYKSRTRKKLIDIINESAGSEIIEERKSQTDKRVKVLHLHLDKIKIEEYDL